MAADESENSLLNNTSGAFTHLALNHLYLLKHIDHKHTHLKEIIQKLKMCWEYTYPQSIQEVVEFVSSSNQIYRNVALYHLLTNGSSSVNGCRQNESPNNW